MPTLELQEIFPEVRERVALAEAIAERLQGRNKRPEKSGNISGLTEQGDTRDIAAAVAVASAVREIFPDAHLRSRSGNRRPQGKRGVSVMS